MNIRCSLLLLLLADFCWKAISSSQDSAKTPNRRFKKKTKGIPLLSEMPILGRLNESSQSLGNRVEICIQFKLKVN